MKIISLTVILLVYLAFPVSAQENSSELIEGEIEISQQDEATETDAESLDEDGSEEASLDTDMKP